MTERRHAEPIDQGPGVNLNPPSYRFCHTCGKSLHADTLGATIRGTCDRCHVNAERRNPEPQIYKGYDCETLLRSHRALAGLLAELQETVNSYQDDGHE